MSIAIRPARLADALGMALAHRAAVHAAVPGIYDQALRDAWAPPIDLGRAERLYLEAQADGQLAFVAEMDGEIVGFAQVHPGRAEILACYVAPAAARRGIGRALVAAVENAVGRHVALTARSSVFAEPFYRSLGFVVTGRSISRFDDGTAMLVVAMRRSMMLAA